MTNITTTTKTTNDESILSITKREYEPHRYLEIMTIYKNGNLKVSVNSHNLFIHIDNMDSEFEIDENYNITITGKVGIQYLNFGEIIKINHPIK